MKYICKGKCGLTKKEKMFSVYNGYRSKKCLQCVSIEKQEYYQQDKDRRKAKIEDSKKDLRDYRKVVISKKITNYLLEKHSA